MGPWKSDFEVVIPHCSPSRLAEVARTRGGKRTKVGLIVRVRDGRIRARYNDFSRTSSAPLLKGRLVQESAGTRIVGKIQWTLVLGAPFTEAAGALACLAAALGFARVGDLVAGLAVLLVAVAFGAQSVMSFRGEGRDRAHEEERLRDSLLNTFTGHGRQM